jgi:FkbM family methyltransferase
MWKRIRNILRAQVCSTLVLDGLWSRVRLMDGSRRWLPRSLGLLAKTVATDATMREECVLAYGAYAGGDVLDIGAEWGTYSFAFAPKASPGARLVSFEPNPSAYRRLHFNLSALGYAFPHLQFIGLPHAVGNGESITFTYPMGESYHPRVVSGGTQGVRSVTVDSVVELLDLSPAFVKIDVEGAEVFVLSGMRQTLMSFRPVVLLEFHPLFQPAGTDRSIVEGLLTDAGYGPASEVVTSEASTRQLWKAGVARPADVAHAKAPA